MSDLRELESAIADAAQRVKRTSAAAVFRATVEQRLVNLESQMGEIKTRLNGLLFFIATTVLAQVLMKVLS